MDSTPAPHLENLVQSVEQKKAAVNSQSAELQALEARIRETEERLAQKKQPRTSSPAGQGMRQASGGSPHRRQPLGDTFGAGGNTAGAGANVMGAEGAAFGATGSYYGPGSGQEGQATQPNTSSPLAADETMRMPGGVENLAASTKTRWMPNDEREAVSEGGR